jgi:hypothetical protein
MRTSKTRLSFSVYDHLDLDDFGPVRQSIAREVGRRRDYRATGQQPAGVWRERINAEGPRYSTAMDIAGYKPSRFGSIFA